MADSVGLVNSSQALDGINFNPTTTTEERVDSQALGQADFFKLLTTQLASQDPLEPMDDTAFIAQMAQFSTLEMQSELNDSFADLSDSMEFQSSRNLIGSLATIQNGSEEVSGYVERVSYSEEDGIPRVYIAGRGYNIEGLSEVGASTTDVELSELTAQLGANVNLKEALEVDNGEGNEPTVVTSGSIIGVDRVNGTLYLTLDSAGSRRFSLDEIDFAASSEG